MTVDEMLQQIDPRVVQCGEVTALKGIVENNEYHPGTTVYEHTLDVLYAFGEHYEDLPESFRRGLESEIDGQSCFRLYLTGLLLHDIGKNVTIRTHNGITRAPGHERLGSYLVFCLLSSLGFTLPQVIYVTDIVAYHGLVHHIIKHEHTDLVRDIAPARDTSGDRFAEYVVAGYVDILGSHLEARNAAKYQRLVQTYQILLCEE